MTDPDGHIPRRSPLTEPTPITPHDSHTTETQPNEELNTHGI